MYRDSDTNLHTRSYYVMTDENNVYKCLYNNEGAASTIGADFHIITTSDGYMWKYMYTISLGEADKFLTASHIIENISATDGSVEGDRQVAVQNAAVNGSIEVIETNNKGDGYEQLANGVVLSTTSTNSQTVSSAVAGDNRASSGANASTTTQSVYISTGTGAGQRRITSYDGIN